MNSTNTTDNKQKVINFFDNKLKENGQKYIMPSEAEDILADALFPHLMVPHYVWILPNRKVQAITSSDELTADNIASLLSDGNKTLILKKDIDAKRPLFLSNDIGVDSILQFSLLIKGKIDGLGGGNKFRESGGIIRGRAITNMPILTIYKIALDKLFKEFNNKRMILEIKDSSKLICNDITEKEIIKWKRENFYSYDLIVPTSDAENLYSFMLEDLNRYSNYYGRIENRKVKCYALVRINNIDKLSTKGGTFESKLFTPTGVHLRNASISKLLVRLNTIEDTHLPVIDETDYEGNIDIVLNDAFQKTASVKEELNKYNLDLIEVERELEMFVLSDKK